MDGDDEDEVVSPYLVRDGVKAEKGSIGAVAILLFSASLKNRRRAAAAAAKRNAPGTALTDLGGEC